MRLGRESRSHLTCPPLKQEPGCPQCQQGRQRASFLNLPHALIPFHCSAPRSGSRWKWIEEQRYAGSREDESKGPPLPPQTAGRQTRDRGAASSAACDFVNTCQKVFSLARPALAAKDLDIYLRTLVLIRSNATRVLFPDFLTFEAPGGLYLTQQSHSEIIRGTDTQGLQPPRLYLSTTSGASWILPACHGHY